jgi:hypothetical protein
MRVRAARGRHSAIPVSVGNSAAKQMAAPKKNRLAISGLTTATGLGQARSSRLDRAIAAISRTRGQACGRCGPIAKLISC